MTDTPTRLFIAAYHGGLSPRYEVVPEGAMGAEEWEPKGAAQCCMCGKKNLSTKEDGGPECELNDGRWVCSSECWDRACDPPEGAGVRVKALEWQEGKFCRQDMFYAETTSGTWMVVCYSGRGFRWTICDSQGNDSDEDWSTPELAKAAAQADFDARIRAALELATEPEPTSGAYDLICCTAEDVATGRGFTGDAAADLAMAQESLRDCLKLLAWRG